jgi:oligopeptide transport system permease protein
VEDVISDAGMRGLQVATISNPAQSTFTDSSGLNPAEQYIYSVVAYVVDPNTQEESVSERAEALKVSLVQTISLSDAQVLKPDAQVGDTIRGNAHLFGTDALGRDIFARMITGTRIDFFLALLVPTVSLLIGLCYGAISGLMGGKVDMILMRIVEILDTLPELLLLILIQVALGKGVSSLVIALCAFSWTGYARVLRGEVLRLREIEFVHASRLLGAPLMSIVFRHVAPNLLGIIIVMWSAQIPRIITSEAFLSLFGLGVEAPMATWGTVLQDAAAHFQQYPAQFFLPASILALTLLAFYTLGDALRDAFDPKLRGRD